MDAVQLILDALAIGATAAAQDTASQAVKDAYSGLKGLVSKRIAKTSSGEKALQAYEADTDTWKKPLQEAIIEGGAEQDEVLLYQAKQLLKRVNPQQATPGKFNIQIGDGKGIVIGDNPHVEQHFGKE